MYSFAGDAGDDLAATANAGTGRPLDRQALAKAIRTCHQANPKLTQEVIALRVGCTQAMVSMVLNGVRGGDADITRYNERKSEPRPAPAAARAAEVWAANPDARPWA